jgi:phage-related baseplate assembly protein
VVETLSYETILAAMLADLTARDPSFSALVESDPAYKLLEVCAYRELILRQRVNDAAKGVMLAYAVGPDLDNLGALLGVTRLQLDPGDPSHSIPPTMESDTDYRRRITLAPEGFSVAGPEGAYIYHALSAHPDVLDASATSPTPGAVVVSVLSRTADGSAPQATLDAVNATLNAANVRPLTDQVTVQSAQIIDFMVTGTRYTFAGPDSAVVLAASDASLAAYLAESHRLGRDITLSGLTAAIHVPGIQRVDLTAPTANIAVDRSQAAWCTSIALAYGGTDE